jgi:Uma2 family endonuclease
MSTPAADLYRRHRFTADEYHRMGESGLFGEDDRVELIEGEIIEMTPIGSRHSGTVIRLNRLLGQAVGDRAILATQSPLRLDVASEPEPDVALLRPRDDFYTTSHPGPADVLLLVEVAEASLRFDREVKVPLYARHGIPAVWLVDLAGRELTAYQQPAGEGYLQQCVITDLAAVELPGLSDLAVDLSGLF